MVREMVPYVNVVFFFNTLFPQAEGPLLSLTEGQLLTS
jgi:hypothetical protein